MSVLTALGRRTVTGLLAASGQQFADWSAAYRLFSRARFDPRALFAVARRAVLDRLPDDQPLVAVMDDTLLRKRGTRVAGASWHRDPLGPKFGTTLAWSQRFIQVALALPEGAGACRARAIPVDLVHAPSPRKPRKAASADAQQAYRAQREQGRLGVRGAACLARLRADLDRDGHAGRTLLASVDGSYTNATVLRHLPERTTLVGRIRKDAKLFAPPGQANEANRRGRRRYYGEALPTPERYRQDGAIPWRQAPAFFHGQAIAVEYKVVSPVRWQAAGNRDLSLVILRPLAYRTAKGRPLSYRDPLYLLCTDPSLDVARLVQAYLWRWEVEVGFRDQKTLLGAGEAQVRTEPAVERVPALVAVAYAFMHLALAQPGNSETLARLPRPCWQRQAPGERISTTRAMNLMRAELWGRALGLGNKTGFGEPNRRHAKPEKDLPQLASAVLYAAR